MAEPEIKYLGDVQRLVLNEGDTLVLKVDHHISDEIAARLRDMMTTQFPGHRLLILDRGMEIGILGKEAP